MLVLNEKPVLYVDFDNTLVNSIKKIVDIWKRKYNGTSKYKPIHWTEIDTFDFKELNVPREEIISYFNLEEFFQHLDFMDNAELILKLFIETGYTVKFVSMGCPNNLELKKKWLSENDIFKNCEFIGIDMAIYKDKNHIDMADGIQIDDEIRYLNTNAQDKICFGDLYEWNHNWTGIRCWNWYEIYNYVTNKCGN